MELQPVVEPHRGELAEVAYVYGSAFAIEADADGALRRLEYGYLIAHNVVFRSMQLRLSESKHLIPSAVSS